MSRPGTFERVYAALKTRLREGAFHPGERLEPAVLADQLNSSVTPVRDALHRLTGERLVEAPRHEGFRVPMLTETALRHLYAWHRDLVLLALAQRKGRDTCFSEVAARAADAAEPSLQTAQIFAAFGRSSGNPEHVAALETVTERLEPLRQAEWMLLDAVEQETADILAAVRDGDVRRLRRSLIRYHRRRERIVPELLERIQAG